MLIKLSKIKNVDELREKATYRYDINERIEEMSENIKNEHDLARPPKGKECGKYKGDIAQNR